MDELEQLKSNFLRSLKAAEEQSGLDLSWLKVQYLQLFEAAQHSVQRTAGTLPQPTPDNQSTIDRQTEVNSRRR